MVAWLLGLAVRREAARSQTSSYAKPTSDQSLSPQSKAHQRVLLRMHHFIHVFHTEILSQTQVVPRIKTFIEPWWVLWIHQQRKGKRRFSGIDSWFIRRSNPSVAISRSWRFYLPSWVLKTWRRQFWCMHENQMWIVEHLCAAFVLSILLGGNVHAASLPIHRLRVTPCDRAWSGPPRKDCMEKTWTWVDNFHAAI